MELTSAKGSSKLSFFLFILIISIGSSDLTISDQGQNQYEPLYVIKRTNDYDFVSAETYDRVMNQGKYNESGEIMLAACSKADTDEKILEISSKNEQQLAGGFRCDSPIEFFAKDRSNADKIHYLIGFMIYDENSISTKKNDYSISNLLPNEFPIPLIKVAYRTETDKYNYSITTWHNIKYSDTLPSIYEESGDPKEYGSDIHIYGFNIDVAYEKENQLKFIQTYYQPNSVPESSPELIKMQLAPAGDFYFEAWKRASRTNINTTPVWKELASEWHQFEEFIRRVSNVVGDLQIITGGADPHLFPQSALKHLHLYTNESALSLPIFEIIYKAVYINQKRKNGQWIRQGMLFVMINDPRDTYQFEKLENLSERYGWKYLNDESSKPRIIGHRMTSDALKKFQVTTVYDYEPLDLNKVIKIVKKGDQETEDKIDVLQKMGLKNEK